MKKVLIFLALLLTSNPVLADGAFVAPSATGQAATGQIPGTATNDAAGAGKVGEVLTASATAVSISTSGIAQTIISKTLTAGDWDVWCTSIFTPAASTLVSVIYHELSPTDNTIPQTLGNYNRSDYAGITLSGTKISLSTPAVPISIASSTTYYCVSFVTFSVSTITNDAIFVARRRR